MLNFINMDTSTKTTTKTTTKNSFALPRELLAADSASSNGSSSSYDICSPPTPPAKRALSDELKREFHMQSPQGSPTSLREEFLRDLTIYGRPRSFTCILMGDDDLLDYEQDTAFAGLKHPLHHVRSRSLDTTSSDVPPNSCVMSDDDDDDVEEEEEEQSTTVRSRYIVRSRRWNSCPGHLSSIPLDEKHLKERRDRCNSEVQKLYEERKDRIMELFQDSWILTTPLDDDDQEECEIEEDSQ